MRSLMAHSLLWSACLAASVVATAKPAAAANCALYARGVTGVALFGAAGGWWAEAQGRYARGQVPAVGSILVFKRTRRIPSGHVAVVSRIVSDHQILVDHANWYRGTVSRGMPVIDTSPSHDWTTVAVLHTPSGTYGADYPTFGFVYPRLEQREIIEAHDRSGAAYVRDGSASSAPLRLALATEETEFDLKTPRTRHRKESAGRPARKEARARSVRKSAAVHSRTHAVTRHKSSRSHGAAPHPVAALESPRRNTIRLSAQRD